MITLVEGRLTFVDIRVGFSPLSSKAERKYKKKNIHRALRAHFEQGITRYTMIIIGKNCFNTAIIC